MNNVVTGALVGAVAEAFKRLTESFLENGTMEQAERMALAMAEARERMAELDPGELPTVSGEVTYWDRENRVVRVYRCEECGFETNDRTLVLHADRWICYSCFKKRLACGAKGNGLIPVRAVRKVRLRRAEEEMAKD